MVDSDPKKRVVSTTASGSSLPPFVGDDVEPGVLEDLGKVDKPDAAYLFLPLFTAALACRTADPADPPRFFADW